MLQRIAEYATWLDLLLLLAVAALLTVWLRIRMRRRWFETLFFAWASALDLRTLSVTRKRRHGACGFGLLLTNGLAYARVEGMFHSPEEISFSTIQLTSCLEEVAPHVTRWLAYGCVPRERKQELRAWARKMTGKRVSMRAVRKAVRRGPDEVRQYLRSMTVKVASYRGRKEQVVVEVGQRTYRLPSTKRVRQWWDDIEDVVTHTITQAARVITPTT